MALWGRRSILGKTRTRKPFASTACLFAILAIGELGQGNSTSFHDQWLVPIYSAVQTDPLPLAEDDVDGDGLSDSHEAELAQAFAPVVVLERTDLAKPASAEWIMRRTEFMNSDSTDHTSFDAQTRKGSNDSRDWVTYANVYPRVDGGIHLEYWFYYPYNDGPLFFDHESDWEHITVRLDEHEKPEGAYLARHENNAPGPFFSWSHLSKEGSHPIVFSAKGTHATYANSADAGLLESVDTCSNPHSCAPHVWRTWEAGGLSRLDGLSDESDVARVFRFSGRWGAKGMLPGTSAPRGPLFQAGHCVIGFSSCQRSPQSDMRKAKL